MNVVRTVWLDRETDMTIRCAAIRGGKSQNDVVIEAIEAALCRKKLFFKRLSPESS